MGEAKKKWQQNLQERDSEIKNLIPGLPDDLAIECLVRVPYQFHSTIKSVCRCWRSLVSGSSFYQERQKSKKAEDLLFLVQPLTATPPPAMTEDETSDVINGESSKKQDSEYQQQQQRVYSTPRFKLTLYNASLDSFKRICLEENDGEVMQIPIPLFCECVAVPSAGKLLLVGGWDPETLQPVPDVYVLDLVDRRWRRGAPMSVARSFFACAACLGGKKVYVAGGHEEQKNALSSAEVYDVERDVWETLPEMEEGRDECYGVVVTEELGFVVVSGYGTESQGRFKSDAEWYDPVTRKWSQIENVWPWPNTSPRGRIAANVAGGGGARECQLWCFSGDEQRGWEIEVMEGKWKMVVNMVKVPVENVVAGGGSFLVASLGGGRVVVMGGKGCEREGGLMVEMEMESGDGNVKWRHRHNTPLGFSGLPFAAASISM